MPLYAEYFENNRTKPKFYIGDRVFGHWNKIPFVGTVGNDNMVSEETGQQVSVFLDLPLSYNGEVKNILIVKQQDIKMLVKM